MLSQKSSLSGIRTALTRQEAMAATAASSTGMSKVPQPCAQGASVANQRHRDGGSGRIAAWQQGPAT